MRVIGIMGGVASGKSLVAGLLADQGAGILDADRAGHEVLQQPNVEKAARERWGNEIFAADGRIDRSRLGRIVFGTGVEAERERKYLEGLTHPIIGQRLAEQASRLKEQGTPVAVLDAPLLLEAGWDRLCDTLLFVDAPRQNRLARALDRGWSEEDFSAREAVQESLHRKRSEADAVIDNSGSAEDVRDQVERLWSALVD